MTLPAVMDLRQFRSGRGSVVTMATREDTMDFDAAMSTIQEDEYHLGDLPDLSGWAIDIGAHIGSVAITLALDNPDLRVLAVEIVPENVEMARFNVERNGVADRVTVLHAAAGGPDEVSRTCYMYHHSSPAATTAYVNKHRYIGNSFWSGAVANDFDSEAVVMDSISLAGMMELVGAERVSFLKTDCEGGEWEILQDPAVSRIDRMAGEYHWDYAFQGDRATRRGDTPRHIRAGNAQDEMAAMLGGTHILTMSDHPSIGHFEAVRLAA